MTCRPLVPLRSLSVSAPFSLSAPLYAAQPIQPVFQDEFGLNRFQAILFTTLIIKYLGFAPLIYGILLENFSAKILVRTAVLLLGILESLSALRNSYLSLLILWGLQGLLIPAIPDLLIIGFLAVLLIVLLFVWFSIRKLKTVQRKG